MLVCWLGAELEEDPAAPELLSPCEVIVSGSTLVSSGNQSCSALSAISGKPIKVCIVIASYKTHRMCALCFLRHKDEIAVMIMLCRVHTWWCQRQTSCLKR